MRICKLVGVFFAIAFFSSCSNESEMRQNEASVSDEIGLSQFTEEEIKVILRMQKPNNRVSIDKAVEQANWVIDFLNTGEPDAIRRINSISALTYDNIEFVEVLKTNKIEVPDTLVYIVNFDDSLGFVIVSADTRIDDPLLAFTGSGSLIDTIDNPGVAIFLGMLEGYMLNSIIEAEQQKNSLIDGILEKLDIKTSTKSIPNLDEVDLSGLLLYVVDNPPEIINEIKPLVPVEWGQGEPFNENLNNNKCPSGKNLTGCVAVVTAQIMSYWKHPSKIGNYSFNWDELNKYKRANNFINNAPDSIKKQVANLMQQIGKGVGMNYGCDKSSANTINAVHFLKQHGFLVSLSFLMAGGMETKTMLINYNSNEAIASMNRKEPLIVKGCSKKINHKFLGFTIYTSYDGCHAWVIDGYLKRRTTTDIYDPITMNVTEINSKVEEYIHNNWGWNGYQNGYFKSGVFNSAPGPNISSSGTKSSENGNYQYDIKMTPYIRR